MLPQQWLKLLNSTSMDSVSCSLLHKPHSPSLFYSNIKCFRTTTPSNYFRQYLPFSLVSPLLSNFPPKLLRLKVNSFTSRSNSHDQNNTSNELAVLLEVEGVLLDAYRAGNRLAFNAAFKKLGLDCANWNEPVYVDLLRKGAGDEEKMLILYFNRIGWPTSLPTNEKGKFIKNVMEEKGKALDEHMLSQSLPLRPGVEDFIDDACDQGVPVVILAVTSRSSDTLIRTLKEKLGHERSSKVIFVGNKEVEQSLYSQLVSRKDLISGVDEQLAKEIRRAASAEKHRIAKEVASMLKLSVNIDPSLSESLDKMVAALRAGAEYAGVPMNKCVLVTGTRSGVAAAEQIIMPCIVLRSSSTSRAEFPTANAIMDGFGGADLTVSKLRSLFQKRRS